MRSLHLNPSIVSKLPFCPFYLFYSPCSQVGLFPRNNLSLVWFIVFGFGQMQYNHLYIRFSTTCNAGSKCERIIRNEMWWWHFHKGGYHLKRTRWCLQSTVSLYGQSQSIPQASQTWKVGSQFWGKATFGHTPSAPIHDEKDTVLQTCNYYTFIN